MDGGAWWAAVHGVVKSRTRLNNFTFTFHFHALEKGMATHSSVLAWRIPGRGEPGGLLSMGSYRVGHDGRLSSSSSSSSDAQSCKSFCNFKEKNLRVQTEDGRVESQGSKSNKKRGKGGFRNKMRGTKCWK